MDKKHLQHNILSASYDRATWQEVLKEYFGVKRLHQNPTPILLTANDIAKSAVELGSFDTVDDRLVGIYEITLKEDATTKIAINKIGLRNLLRSVYKYDVDGALIVFIHGNKWRFSYVSEIRTEEGKIETEPKRYTYLFGEGEGCRTASDRFENIKGKPISLIDLSDAFSVDTLTKQFYKELFDWYQWALSATDGFAVTYPNDTSTEVDDRKIEEHIIRLITRLMFVWFIKQKKLVPNELFSMVALKQILKDFDPQSKKQGNYYNAILQNLFFATLNKAIDERAFANDGEHKSRKEHYGIKSLFRNPKNDTWFAKTNEEIVNIFSSVPFLNGGLFECLDKETDSKGKIMYFDGFSREAGRQQRAFIPNCLFFDPLKGIIPLLEKYNFTIEENTPTEIEVALDPELLGKVFENLLGAYNPETKETARKQSGSFYTPREIVNYMVDESLIAHLNTKCPKVGEEQIRQLFKPEANSINLDNSTRLAIINELKSAKILDPACGSGAFPMGVLNRMVNLLQKLNDEEASTPYQQKLHLIENCIYGVDIQTIAVQISKLRFFISLVCEQTPNANKADNYGITPLPNLETKFVAANTLIGLEKAFTDKLDLGFTEIRKLKESLWNIRSQHFSARNASVKHELRNTDQKLRKEIQTKLVDIATKPDLEKMERLQTEIKALQTEKEQYKGENWVSLLPPQAKQISMFDDHKAPEQQSLQIDKNKEERTRIEKLIKEKQKELEKETAKTKIPGFENEAAQLAVWNPYDQNTSSHFFDADWMFDAKQGFDVVIGNPPYVQLQKDGGKLANQLKSQKFETFEKTGDIYALFYEKGFQLLFNGGIHTFITSSQWMKAAYGKSLRKYFLKQNPLKLILLGPGVFENATVDTNILIAQKGLYKKELKGLIVKNKMDFAFNNAFLDMGYVSEATWAIIDSTKQSIKSKIEEKGKQLKDWDIKINFGIKTGINEVFIIDEIKRDELINIHKSADEFIRPLLRGRTINKYHTDWDGDFIIATFPALQIDIEKYPSIKQYLQQFRPKIDQIGEEFVNEQGQKEKTRKKTSNEWFETQDQIGYVNEFKKEKIVWKRIGSQLRFSFLDNEIYCLDSTCIATGEKVKYLTALLNSKLCNYELFENAPKTGMGDLIISVQALEPLYVYYPNGKEEKLIVSLVDRILTAKKANPQANTTDLEQQIDNMVYKLYELTYAEVKVIDPKFGLTEAEYEAINLE